MEISKIKILSSYPPIYRAVKLEFLFPRNPRLKIIKTLFVLIFIFILLFIAPYFENRLSTLVDFVPQLGIYQIFFLAFLIMAVSTLFALLLVEFYFLSVSRPLDFLEVTTSDEARKIYHLDFGGARRLFYLDVLRKDTSDLAKLYSFLQSGRSNFIRLLFLRLNVPYADFNNFSLTDPSKNLKFTREELLSSLVKSADSLNSDTIGAKEFIDTLFGKDKKFQDFLFKYGIRKKEILGAASWAGSSLEESRGKKRWWEKSELGKIQGIGKNLGFGYTYTLDRYSRDVQPKTSSDLRFLAHKKEIVAIEDGLARSPRDNIFLVGEPGVGKHTIVEALAGKILEGKVSPAIEHKRMVNLDTTSLTAAAKVKGALEELTIKVMNEAVAAGNIILVIDNFPEFLDSASGLNVEMVSLLEPYLEGSGLQILALSDNYAYHQKIEPNGKLTTLFEKVDVVESSAEDTTKILQDITPALEQKYGIFVSYQGLQTVAELSERYINQGVMPEKAVNLLDSVMVYVSSKDVKVLLPKDVQVVLEKSLNIPISKATGKEAEKLLNLENILHERIVNQKEAIEAVANAMRRVRTGLHTGQRPVGSFLFMGPTGVGKTETAKALSHVYFGDESAMTRFDMSEFQGADGIEKLIGAFGKKRQGLLSVALRERPFSLLLFDEFEKSSRDVLNLFLQILDEGIFTDSSGKKVSAKDAIIIATSNAGSNLIWDLVRANKDPADIQKEVVDHVRKKGIFTPEILNRFDAIVVYHPLSRENLKQVAKLLLKDLAERLKDKEDVVLEIADDLVEKIVEIGYDPVLGARPMRRAIQDRLEQFIAKKMLRGELKRGNALKLYPEDIKNL